MRRRLPLPRVLPMTRLAGQSSGGSCNKANPWTALQWLPFSSSRGIG
jgi:hypothetical protein